MVFQQACAPFVSRHPALRMPHTTPSAPAGRLACIAARQGASSFWTAALLQQCSCDLLHFLKLAMSKGSSAPSLCCMAHRACKRSCDKIAKPYKTLCLMLLKRLTVLYFYTPLTALKRAP